VKLTLSGLCQQGKWGNGVAILAGRIHSLMPPDQLPGRGKTPEPVRSRGLLFYDARSEPGMTTVELSGQLVNRTALHGAGRIDAGISLCRLRNQSWGCRRIKTSTCPLIFPRVSMTRAPMYTRTMPPKSQERVLLPYVVKSKIAEPVNAMDSLKRVITSGSRFAP